MKAIDLNVSEYWLGHGDLHEAPYGHAWWVEENLGFRGEGYADGAEAEGYSRVVVSRFTGKIYVDSSVRRFTWESFSSVERRAMEDLAYAHGISVYFQGKEVIEVGKEVKADANRNQKHE
jgi:hypothetical protein